MEDFQKRFRKIINFFIAVFVVALIAIIICLIMLKYEVEGENNMPFELSQIVTVSTAEGISAEGEATWNFELVQNNDIYIHISKNKNYRETEIIKNITINNLKINNAPRQGNVVIYRPSKDENKTFEYLDEYIVNDSLVYKGDDGTNIKDLQISNQGGVISLRVSNKDLREIFIR